MSLNLRQTLRRWTTSTGIGGPIHRNTQTKLRPLVKIAAALLFLLALTVPWLFGAVRVRLHTVGLSEACGSVDDKDDRSAARQGLSMYDVCWAVEPTLRDDQ